MKRLTAALALLLVTASVAPLAAAGQQADGKAYAGTHVSFETENRAVTNYQVDGKTFVDAVKVQSAESAESGGLVDADASLSAVTSLDGSAVSVGAKTKASATVGAEGSATMEAHDNEDGVLVVAAGGDAQYVQANLSSDTQASAQSGEQVLIQTEDGTKGTFIVVGDGEVTVNEDGDVVARLGPDGKLVFRAYPEGKNSDDEKQEGLIADGKAAAEVHVMEKDGETVVDTISYGQETTVAAEQSAENAVEVTVDRASGEGTIVITTVSEAVVESTDDLQVTVDGEAAARASSYTELAGAIGGEESMYMVRQSSNGQASADVLVGVNHFSERTIRMSSGDGSGDDSGGSNADGTPDGSGSGDDADDGVMPGDGQPGFGVVVALVALGAALVAARFR